MPELVEQMYCSQQIVIPPKFPYILKRYCKAAIKTQPYDLLRWSFEYFKALSQRRPPPVKLRLEYPIYSTEGGLTRGCLKVLANQLSGMTVVPIPCARAAWQGFCLDPEEFLRILCLCEVYLREDQVPLLHFLAVAAGMLTKTLTHTMILLCETLTKEPDGASAAICVQDFLQMYRFLARMDASADVKYINGYREGEKPPEEAEEEEEEQTPESTPSQSEDLDYDFWGDSASDLQKIPLVNDHVARTTQISEKLGMPVLGEIARCPSVERMVQIERQDYMMDRKDKPISSAEVDAQLRDLSATKFGSAQAVVSSVEAPKKELKPAPSRGPNDVDIIVYDEDDKVIPNEFYGQPEEALGEEEMGEEDETEVSEAQSKSKSQHAATATISSKSVQVEGEDEAETEAGKIRNYVNSSLQEREERREDLMQTFEEIAQIVDRFKAANYDLGMVAGRQMSTTSGEFIVGYIEKELLEYIDEQIAVLPDPDLKKKKARPEEVLMIRCILTQFLDENMDIIVPDLEEVEEEEEFVPEIVQVYAVPGIGPPVDADIVRDFVEYALDVCKSQADVFMPRNIRHFLCPPLERFEEYRYDDMTLNCKKEDGVAVGGVITD